MLRHATQDRQQGASLIEFALVLPVFLALIVGILFFGIAFVTQQAVNYAAESGAEAAVSVDPDAANFDAIATLQAGERIAGILSAFPGVDRGQPFPLVFQCPGAAGVADRDTVSTICVLDDAADDGARRVVISLAPRFQALLPGFPQADFFVTPEYVRASGSAVVAEPAGG